MDLDLSLTIILHLREESIDFKWQSPCCATNSLCDLVQVLLPLWASSCQCVQWCTSIGLKGLKDTLLLSTSIKHQTAANWSLSPRNIPRHHYPRLLLRSWTWLLLPYLPLRTWSPAINNLHKQFSKLSFYISFGLTTQIKWKLFACSFINLVRRA